ncbi:MAG: bifunctional phosphoglucose/phosphomannose isomerase [Candidatus Helarchaeota archaeon]|nr:bifunctional phosphoglucose/phosphomannose isomerase [Candidatus Helarchaeota archaeon]
MINDFILDDENRIKEIDKDDMYKFLMNMPDSCAEILTMSKKIQFSHEIKEFGHILICGMGGSAIGGNLVQDLLIDKIPIPIIIHRGYKIPAFINKRTLMIVISYSGNTEETLSAFAEGIEHKCTIIGLSSNGKLIEYCKKLGIEYIKVPAEIQPRAAIPYLFIAILIILQKLKIIQNFTQDLEESISVLKNLREELAIKSPNTNNLAKKIAIGIKGAIPMIYATSGYGSLARRMKCQINENSKNPAHWDEFPELNHNEIVGWELKSDITQKCCVILLRINEEDEAIKNRIEITKDVVLKDKFKEIFEIWGHGTSKLAKMFSLLFIGDCISYYLAILNGVDPTPVKSISELKKKLKERLNILNLIEKKLFSA